MKIRPIAVAIALSGALVGSLTTSPATAEPAPFTPWSSYLPGWTDEYIPTSANDCVAGRPNCLKATLRELAKIHDETVQACSHNAVFALAYLRITQMYEWSVDQPGYYEDVPFANHQDAVFAKYYIDAYTNWKAGARSEVPKAWLMAFDAGKNKRVNGTGDLLLGMNAHINRDLPFVLEAVGLVAPDGSSRKPDYNKVEHFLNLGTEPMLAEAAARLDPGIDDANDPLGAAYYVLFQLISTMRETAWRNAEALVSAPTPAARALVAEGIERSAELAATSIIAAQSYLWPLTTAGPRGNYCAANNGATAPLAYAFGTPKVYGH